MNCIFDDSEVLALILFQLRDYCLSFMDTGACAIQTNQITLVCTSYEASLFEQGRCSDIILIQPTNFDGNHEYYTYKSISIVIYKVSLPK